MGSLNRCMHGALALLQLEVTAVTSAETRVERDRSPVFLGFFLLVLNFYMIYWAHSWLPYTYACWKTLYQLSWALGRNCLCRERCGL